MSDDLLAYHREYGSPPRQCSYSENDDGSIRVANMKNAACLSDFSDLAFFVEPKKKPKLSGWRKHEPPPMPPPKKKSKLEPWRK